MTRIVHIANTDVELELANSIQLSLEKGWSNPLCFQLQYLPLLYAQSDEFIAVSSLPDPEFLRAFQQSEWGNSESPTFILFKDRDPLPEASCVSWGPSKRVAEWAKNRLLHYDLPEWKTVQEVNSKAFSFRYSTLQEAALLINENELRLWLGKFEGPKVLKTCFGLSGKGNKLFNQTEPSNELVSFCKKEWNQKRPIIGEPWLNRILDFSTQWIIYPNTQIEYRGATRFKTDQYGKYEGTIAGPENELFSSYLDFLYQHKELALKALQDMAKMGFFGPVGIDALLYRCTSSIIHLYPIVEINARQTMSLVALKLQKRLFPHQMMLLSFHSNPSAGSLLPIHTFDNVGKIMTFKKFLTAELLTAL